MHRAPSAGAAAAAAPAAAGSPAAAPPKSKREIAEAERIAGGAWKKKKGTSTAGEPTVEWVRSRNPIPEIAMLPFDVKKTGATGPGTFPYMKMGYTAGTTTKDWRTPSEEGDGLREKPPPPELFASGPLKMLYMPQPNEGWPSTRATQARDDAQRRSANMYNCALRLGRHTIGFGVSRDHVPFTDRERRAVNSEIQLLGGDFKEITLSQEEMDCYLLHEKPLKGDVYRYFKPKLAVYMREVKDQHSFLLLGRKNLSTPMATAIVSTDRYDPAKAKAGDAKLTDAQFSSAKALASVLIHGPIELFQDYSSGEVRPLEIPRLQERFSPFFKPKGMLKPITVKYTTEIDGESHSWSVNLSGYAAALYLWSPTDLGKIVDVVNKLLPNRSRPAEDDSSADDDGAAAPMQRMTAKLYKQREEEMKTKLTTAFGALGKPALSKMAIALEVSLLASANAEQIAEALIEKIFPELPVTAANNAVLAAQAAATAAAVASATEAAQAAADAEEEVEAAPAPEGEGEGEGGDDDDDLLDDDDEGDLQ